MFVWTGCFNNRFYNNIQKKHQSWLSGNIEKPNFQNALQVQKNGSKKIKFRIFENGQGKLCRENESHTTNIFHYFHFQNMIVFYYTMTISL